MIRPPKTRGIGLAAALAVLSLSSCADSRPPIGSGLPWDIAEGRSAFNQRVTDRFPVGSSEQALLTELRRERFTVTAIPQPDPYQSRAAYTAHQIVCAATWTVVWRSEDGTIAAIAGGYGTVCL